MSEETDIHLPSTLSNQISTFNFGVSSVWTLPFIKYDSQYFITFYISKIILWQYDKEINEICSFEVEGMIQKNRAVLIQDCLYFVLNDNYLYCIKDIFDADQKIQKNNFAVEYITISKNHDSAIILTTNQYIYFAYSNGKIKSASRRPLSYTVSFIKDFGDGVYIGAIQNKLYKFNKDFRFVDKDEQEEFSTITNIFGEINNAIIIGYSKNRSVTITKGKIFTDEDQISISHVVANYESFYILQNKTEIWQPSYALVSESEIILFNSELYIVAKKPITKTDFIISSFIAKNKDMNKLFIHFSKSGLHSYTPYDRDCQISQENINEILFYYAYLFERADNDEDKQRFVSEFYDKFSQYTKEKNLGKVISQMEMDAFEEHKSEWTYDKILRVHNCLIRMMSYTEDTDEIIPFLNTNAIYLRLIYNCADDDNLYQYSTFGKLNDLIKNFTISSLTKLIVSINESIKLTFGDFYGVFSGYQNLYQLINDLLFKKANNSLERFQLIKCKYMLTREFYIKDVSIDDLKADMDKYEEFALEHEIIDILYEIIMILSKTSNLKRAKKYSKIKKLNILYDKFPANSDIKRKLAILQGWESLDKFVLYENGQVIDCKSPENTEKISANTLALLCSSIIDNQEEEEDMDYYIQNLNIKLFPSLA